MTLVTERLKGEVASFDIVGRDGEVIVAKDKRITARHIRQMADMKTVSVNDDFLIGRVLAKDIIDGETGEVLAAANDEITEELLAKLREAKIKGFQTIYTNELDQGSFISDTLRIDEPPDQMSARVAIYRMMRPG